MTVITHYSKSSEYLPGEEFVDNRYRNSWNAVFVAGGWRLVQANWGMLSVNNKMARETRQIYQGCHGAINRIDQCVPLYTTSYLRKCQ